MVIQIDPTKAAAATIVAEDGSEERAEFRGRLGSRVFTYLHLPASPPRGAVLICSPLHGEFAANYRREVLIARALAQAGFAVERFHYRYSGNSDGETKELTFDSMRADALDCIAHLRREAREGPLFIVGTRWGTLIAASAGAEHGDAALVLCEPLLEASTFFKNAFRSRLIREIRGGAADPSSGEELESQLRSGSVVDVVAHRLEPALYRSSIDRTLEAELGTVPRRVLVVQVGPTGSVRPDVQRLLERWREVGLRVDAAGVRAKGAWWLIDENYVDETARPSTRPLIEITTTWISAITRESEEM